MEQLHAFRVKMRALNQAWMNSSIGKRNHDRQPDSPA
jgi:hypothetical protein